MVEREVSSIAIVDSTNVENDREILWDMICWRFFDMASQAGQKQIP